MQVTALAYSGQHSRLLSTGEDSRLVCWNMEMPRLEKNNLRTHYYRRSLKLERNYLQTFTVRHTFGSEYTLYKAGGPQTYLGLTCTWVQLRT